MKFDTILSHFSIKVMFREGGAVKLKLNPIFSAYFHNHCDASKNETKV